MHTLIRDMTPARPPETERTVHGVSLGPTGGAIATAVHRADGSTRLVGFAAFPPRLDPIGAAILGLPEADTVVLDGGLHGADLWTFLLRRRRMQLFEVSHPSRRRMEIAGPLRAAYESRAFTASPMLRLTTPLSAALKDIARDTAADSPAVAALALAVRRPPRPRIL